MNVADPGSHRKKVVLLGVGHTNAHVLKEWAINPIPNCDLVCISNYSTASYSGMLPGVLGWQFSENEMQIDLQALAKRSDAKLVIANTTGLDLESGEILFSDRQSISFDALSIGIGSVPAGSEQYSKSPLLVPTKPMQTLLQRLSNRLDAQPASQSDSLQVAIVGGGVASVEIAFCLHRQLLERDLNCNFSIKIFTRR